MNKLDQLWQEISVLETDNQVIGFWENRQARITKHLLRENTDFTSAILIIHRFAKALNRREKYSSIYFLYNTAYEPLENKFSSSPMLNELKFELAFGLHHNRKYHQAKKLFNELGSTNFDTSRIEDWWSQAILSSYWEKNWVKIRLVPLVSRFILFAIYLLIAINTKAYLASTTVFIVLFEVLETVWYHFTVSLYLKDFEELEEIGTIKKKIRRLIWIEAIISVLFYPLYFIKPEWAFPLIIGISIYFMAFHVFLNFHYLFHITEKLTGLQAKKEKRT